ncbi:hypothetical protein GLAREA_08016 [Glarea lozoyensis ATCC 20868]|uniref:C2H2-type domain-containing protein n=1 Tax=Glarea lozoyensis (strain ATCC 20868 / MF5171) TaxID=1116229 RepID=S3CWG7_GLAL2|nr:uncharacterized protein GLAREA_08016 [Glarea lozoyensis ATCC 20868]EPE24166.1 hypothetical protein GLAREA_08016 [Glarea lozoyensis ATCC 20868]
MSPPKTEFDVKEIASRGGEKAGDAIRTDQAATNGWNSLQENSMRSFDTIIEGHSDLARDSDKDSHFYSEQTGGDWESTSQLLHNDGGFHSPSGFSSSSATIYASMDSTASDSATHLSTETVESFQIEHPKTKRTIQMTEADRVTDITEQNLRPLKQTRRECSQTIEIVKLACPYRQRDPKMYNTTSEKVCARSEHLYRCHRAPIHCKRCSKLFKNEAELVSHASGAVACEFQYVPPIGMTRDTETILRKRKKGQGVVSSSQSVEAEIEKWKEIYRILFPAAQEIPNPIFEPALDEITASQLIAVLEKYDHYSRRELPAVIISALQRNSRVFVTSGFLGDDFKDIVLDSQSKVFGQYLKTLETQQPGGEYSLAAYNNPGTGSTMTSRAALDNYLSEDWSGMTELPSDGTSLVYIPQDASYFTNNSENYIKPLGESDFVGDLLQFDKGTDFSND